MTKTPIDIACDLLGGQNKLAAKLGVTKQAVSKWRRQQVPAERVLRIEEITAGRVPRHSLRPDIYPPPSTAA
ncbi:MAG: chaperone [Chloroflexota bacterium]|nr:MAG: chaperone [Chloroflexota bacterium]